MEATEVEIYKLNKKLIFLSVIMAIASLFAGFVMNFSMEDKLLSFLEDGLRKNRSCPISYKKASIGYFLPKLEMDNIEISSRCLRTPEALVIESAKLSLALPSISPMGISFNTNIEKLGGLDTNINVKSIHNFSSQYIRIEDSNINLKSFDALMQSFKLQGNIKLNTFLSTDLNTLKQLDLYALSTDFTLPAQSIQNFELPALPIKNLSLKAHSENGKEVEIKEFIIGDQNSPIRASASGTIEINEKNIQRSKIDIEAQVKFSAEFIEQFAIINLLLGNTKPDEQGFYHMRIDGILARPNAPKMINR